MVERRTGEKAGVFPCFFSSLKRVKKYDFEKVFFVHFNTMNFIQKESEIRHALFYCFGRGFFIQKGGILTMRATVRQFMLCSRKTSKSSASSNTKDWKFSSFNGFRELRRHTIRFWGGRLSTSAGSLPSCLLATSSPMLLESHGYISLIGTKKRKRRIEYAPRSPVCVRPFQKQLPGEYN